MLLFYIQLLPWLSHNGPHRLSFRVSFNDPSSTEKLVVGKRRSISQSSGQASDAIATPILELPGSPNNDTAPLKAKLLSQN